MSKIKFYRLDKILATGADYCMILGERSNGKTYSVLEYGLNKWFNSNFTHSMAIIRRFDEDFRGEKGKKVFTSFVENGMVSRITNKMFNGIYYYSMKWYLCRYNEQGKREFTQEEPFAIGFSLSSEEHYKMLSFPDIKTILFDEFITRGYYLTDEFIKFTSLLSTIIRLRDDLKIFMLANTINKYSPYFAEMGIFNIKNQKKGTIDIYTYGESNLKVAVEYSDFETKDKKSNKYFAFNNPKLEMIKNGGWEIDIYPHLPYKYLPKEIIFTYFIEFDNDILQCEIISHKEENKIYNFTFIHRKTTKIKDIDKNNNIVFSQEIDVNNRRRRFINKPYDRIGKKIWEFYLKEKVFYQCNDLGEIVRNYLKWCKRGVDNGVY